MFRLPDAWVWDFWLAQHEDSHHLFFLYASRALHEPGRRHLRAGIGHAVSTDLTNWERVADAIVRDDPPSFDQTATWTGSVVRGPGGSWSMFYTGTTQLPDGTLRQQIGRAASDDLYYWVKDELNPLVCADSCWYETLGGRAQLSQEELSGGSVPDEPWRDEHWRDPFVFADPAGDGWHMLITARANHGPLDDRGVVGHARSWDLQRWRVEPPLSEPGAGFGQLEVFQLEHIDGCWVLIFNCLASEFSAARAAGGGPGGVWAAIGESALGPFDLKGATRLTDEGLYVGKVMRDPRGNWVFLAFENDDGSGGFVGSLTDPLPVGWSGGKLVVGT